MDELKKSLVKQFPKDELIFFDCQTKVDVKRNNTYHSLCFTISRKDSFFIEKSCIPECYYIDRIRVVNDKSYFLNSFGGTGINIAEAITDMINQNADAS